MRPPWPLAARVPDLMRQWLLAFLLTQLVEMPIYRRGLGVSWPAAFAASAITHPIVWLVFFTTRVPMETVGYWPRVVSAECFAWLVEAAWFAWILRRPRALLWSAIANGTSVAVGFLRYALLD